MPTTETIPTTATAVAAPPAAAVAEEPAPLYIPPRKPIVNEPESRENAAPPEVESPPGLSPTVGSPAPGNPPPKGIPREWREWVDHRLAVVSERHAGEAAAIRDTVDAFVVEVRDRFAETDAKLERLAADFEAFKREVVRLIEASEKRTEALIRESEERTRALIRKSEKRVTKRLTKVVTRLIEESEGRLTALVEKTQARADKRLDRMETRNNILFAALLAGVFGALGALVTAWMTGAL